MPFTAATGYLVQGFPLLYIISTGEQQKHTGKKFFLKKGEIENKMWRTCNAIKGFATSYVDGNTSYTLLHHGRTSTILPCV